MNDVELSKFLSYVLRHKPDSIGLNLDPHGWVMVDELLERAQQSGKPLSREALERVVRQSDKQRFALSEDGNSIRANQGHSVNVDLALPDRSPPELLYHGTAKRFLEAIMTEGLKPQSRHDVHLSPTQETAHKVGSRHGSPVVLTVRSGDMARAGHRFQCSENGVWLTSDVPPQYLHVDEHVR